MDTSELHLMRYIHVCPCSEGDPLRNDPLHLIHSMHACTADCPDATLAPHSHFFRHPCPYRPCTFATNDWRHISRSARKKGRRGAAGGQRWQDGYCGRGEKEQR